MKGLIRQPSSSYPRCDSDTVGVEPVTDIFNEMHGVHAAAVSPIRRNCSETYDDGTALDYEGDISDWDCWSVENRERDTWEDWYESAFPNGYGAFPPDRDYPLLTVVFSNKLFSDEDPVDVPGSDKKESTLSVLQVFT